MKVKDFKDRYKLTLKEVASAVQPLFYRKVTEQMVQNWISQDAVFSNKGKTIYALFYPAKLIASSKEYRTRSRQLGVNQ